MNALIFDCFGVLVLNSQEFFENIAKNSKQSELAHDLFFQFSFGMISKGEFIDELAFNFELEREKVAEILENQQNINQKLIDFLKEKRHHGSKIAILSNVAQYFFDEIFPPEMQNELFDAIILSENEKIRKPDLRIFEIACEKLGENPENCVMIDDLEENISAAKKFGMRGVIYSNFEKFKIEMEENARIA